VSAFIVMSSTILFVLTFQPHGKTVVDQHDAASVRASLKSHTCTVASAESVTASHAACSVEPARVMSSMTHFAPLSSSLATHVSTPAATSAAHASSHMAFVTLVAATRAGGSAPSKTSIAQASAALAGRGHSLQLRAMVAGFT
jgi:hypothetical protein